MVVSDSGPTALVSSPAVFSMCSFDLLEELLCRLCKAKRGLFVSLFRLSSPLFDVHKTGEVTRINTARKRRISVRIWKCEKWEKHFLLLSPSRVSGRKSEDQKMAAGGFLSINKEGNWRRRTRNTGRGTTVSSTSRRDTPTTTTNTSSSSSSSGFSMGSSSFSTKRSAERRSTRTATPPKSFVRFSSSAELAWCFQEKIQQSHFALQFPHQ